ncbi:MAG: aldehyde ferredoxin oxidoreductase family protein [Bacteroidetes bacterium]|nr:aldehyde ferredoxin oxidoreductase family protein [Bacteroidota bacterium]MCL5025055.1 aldehyde ferredoxin oxidoreductase family protein [Chloroflexota bacterium]
MAEAGKLLRVNLSQGSVTTEPIGVDVARDYIGGIGLATRIVTSEVPASADALGPQNKVVFAAGPISGSAFPCTASYAVGAKSPVTGTFIDGASAGFWGGALKRAGYDAIVIDGASARPVYLLVDKDGGKLAPAGDLWGMDALKVQETLPEKLGVRDLRVIGIGPAGEKKAPLACIVSDAGHTTGRGGLGAVLGAKGLKAIAVNGSGRVRPAREDSFRTLARRWTGTVAAHRRSAPLAKWGTATRMDTAWFYGAVPARNWSVPADKDAAIPLGGKAIADTILGFHESCQGCPIRCTRWVEIKDGPYPMEGPGPEYEALAAFGTLCGSGSLATACAANDMCNRYGLDAVSTGGAIAFGMEAYQKGLITKADAGTELKWGDGEAILAMVKDIAEGKGFGKVLGQGVRAAAAAIGSGADAFAIHVRGLEVPPFDPRAYLGLAVTYATGPNAVCDLYSVPTAFDHFTVMPEAGILHRQGRFDHKGKGMEAKVAQDFTAITDSMVICPHAALALAPLHIGEVLAAATGLPYDSAAVLKAGERITNAQRAFNLKASAGPDGLPARLLEAMVGKAPDLAFQLAEYYRVRGWSEKGEPSPEKLAELGLA